MASVNKVILIGHLGQDPDTRTFANGGAVANTSLATSRRWKDKQTGAPREETEWHRLVFNNRLAEIASQYLRKGSLIYVEGSLRTRKWQDQSGADRYVTEIRVDQLQMLDRRADAAAAPAPTASGPNSYAAAKQGSAAPAAAPAAPAEDLGEDEDIPF